MHVLACRTSSWARHWSFESERSRGSRVLHAIQKLGMNVKTGNWRRPPGFMSYCIYCFCVPLEFAYAGCSREKVGSRLSGKAARGVELEMTPSGSLVSGSSGMDCLDWWFGFGFEPLALGKGKTSPQLQTTNPKRQNWWGSRSHL